MRSLSLNIVALVAIVIVFHCLKPLTTGAQQANNASGVKDVGHAASSDSGTRGESWAVLIGPTNYTEAPKLDYCENDMLTIADALIRSGEYDPKRIWFLGNGDTDFENGEFLGLKLPARENCKHPAEVAAIKETLETVMTKTRPADTLFIAFSGHGALDDKREPYLLPLPGFHSSLQPDRALQVQWLLQQLADDTKCRAARKIVVLDACHSGSALKFNVPQVTDSAAENEMLGTDHQGEGTLLITSCASDEFSYEYPRDDNVILRQAIFSHFLADALRGTADADRDRDGSVTAIEAFVYTRDNVQKFAREKLTAGAKQSPQWKLLDGNANFKLATVREPSPSLPETDLDFNIQAFTPTSGGWWFDETPLTAPRLRLELSKRKFSAKPVEGAVAVSPYDIEVAAQELIGSTPGTDYLVALKRLRDKTDSRADIFNGLIDEMKAQASDSPTELHLLAVLYSQVRKYTEAKEIFQRALKEYDLPRLKGKVDGLRSLCYADYAKTLGEMKDYNSAINNYELAYTKFANKSPIPFKIYCLSCQADLYRSLGEWDSAAKILETAESLARGIPEKRMLAFVHERSAWLNMDRWNVQDARKSFGKALELRQLELERTWPAQVAVLQDRHGQLVADRFAGNVPLGDLDRSYDALIKEIQEQYRKQTRTAEKRALLIRLANTYERAADPHVFTCNFTNLRELPPAKDQERLQRAVTRLTAARRTLNNPLVDAEYASSLPRLQFKMAIALALRGRKVTASEALQQGIEAQKQLPDIENDPALVYLQVSQAVVELLHHVIADAAPTDSISTDSLIQKQKTLRDVVLLYGDKDRRSKLKRDEMELLLFASCLLAASHGEPQGRTRLPELARKSDINFSKSIAYELNRSPPQLLRFLRPYFSTAIRSTIQCTDLDYEDAAQLILVSKYGEAPNYDGPAVLFHIDEVGIVALIWTGEKWLKASDCLAFEKTKRAKLGDVFFETLKQFAQAGITLQVFWRDPQLDIGNDQFPDIPGITLQLLPATDSP